MQDVVFILVLPTIVRRKSRLFGMRFVGSRSRRVTPSLTKASFGRNGFLTGQQLYAQSPKNIMTKKHMVRLLTADVGSCFEPKNKHHVVIKIEFKKTPKLYPKLKSKSSAAYILYCLHLEKDNYECLVKCHTYTNHQCIHMHKLQLCGLNAEEQLLFFLSH